MLSGMAEREPCLLIEALDEVIVAAAHREALIVLRPVLAR